MTQKEIDNGNKLIAAFMGLVYIPWNNLQGYSHPGWWTDIDNLPKKTEHIQNIRKDFCKNANSKIGRRYLKCRTSKELIYNSSWNWLMPVVEKIGNLYEQGVYKPMLIFNVTIFATKEDMYKGVVEFIKWYNENK